ncbi:hypothetical protein GTO89_14135 [Heliobacterium gestii]|uniref:Uncharacterized protein n=1 Tax=Heliomicrobium gestii TaxID=2699 RepID=A0A845LLB4_HELGE|nr:hypothetical protein [Heliomicrobium gestii]MBM7867780.1 hypothetical protein [Heliomicrobium gestii]MZP44173.1 hypothetical protein [Heliomicrobium gestii]
MTKLQEQLLDTPEQLVAEIDGLDQKLSKITWEVSTLETQETSLLQRVIENILPALDKIYRSGIKFPIANTGHHYPEIVLVYDEQKKIFYTLTKNGEIMGRDFITPSDVNLLPTWVFVSKYPLETVIGNIADAIERYRAFVVDAEARHEQRKQFLVKIPQLKIPNL